MRKQWLGICIAAGMLAACTSDDGQQQTVSVPQPAVCNGPIVEISGADPRFEPLNATVKATKSCRIRLDLARRDWRQSMMPNPAVT